MKTLQAIARCATIVALLTASYLSNAQVINLQTSGANRWGRLNPVAGFNAQSIGVGNFPGGAGGTAPAAALHINTNLLTPPVFYGAGNVFRTQAPKSQTQAWRMFSGTGAGTQQFAIVNPGGINNDIFMGVVPSGNLSFFTDNIHRMRITPTGYVAIGLNFTNPVADLHLHSTQSFAFATILKITNGTTCPCTQNINSA